MSRDGVDLRWLDAILTAGLALAPGPFAGYFRTGFAHDHVVVERWDGQRWVRSDPEVDAAFGAAPPAGAPFDPVDMPTGPDSPFPTAAELWLAHRRDGMDLAAYGVAPHLPDLCGPDLVRGYVLQELAHRRRDVLLLRQVRRPCRCRKSLAKTPSGSRRVSSASWSSQRG